VESWREIRRGGLPLPRRAPEHYGEAIRTRWTRKWKRELGIAGECVDPLLDSRLADHYGWASHLASYYAGRYRNAFSLGYLFSSIAVYWARAVATSALRSGSHRPWSRRVSRSPCCRRSRGQRARRGRFQSAGRLSPLTEGFRSLSYAAVRPRFDTDASGGSGREHWGDWLPGRGREVGILSAAMISPPAGSAQPLLDDVLREQIAYHGWNATTLSRSIASTAGAQAVLLAIFIALWHLVDGIEHLMSREGLQLEKLTLALGVLAITIPAATAAAQGFLSQGEFE
jgi:hypothetical protein